MTAAVVGAVLYVLAHALAGIGVAVAVVLVQARRDAP